MDDNLEAVEQFLPLLATLPPLVFHAGLWIMDEIAIRRVTPTPRFAGVNLPIIKNCEGFELPNPCASFNGHLKLGSSTS
jgi:hypothetical protein